MKHQNLSSLKNIKQQNGAVLAISLILLLVVTIIGTTSMQTSTLQERMAGNTNNDNTAFQAAEAALRNGENAVTGTLGSFSAATTTTGLYVPRTDGTNWWDHSSTWATDGSGSAQGTATSAVTQYIIEKLPAQTSSGGSLEAGTQKSSDYFRITAQSIGATSGSTSLVMLQSVYKR